MDTDPKMNDLLLWKLRPIGKSDQIQYKLPKIAEAFPNIFFTAKSWYYLCIQLSSCCSWNAIRFYVLAVLLFVILLWLQILCSDSSICSLFRQAPQVVSAVHWAATKSGWDAHESHLNQQWLHIKSVGKFFAVRFYEINLFQPIPHTTVLQWLPIYVVPCFAYEHRYGRI